MRLVNHNTYPLSIMSIEKDKENPRKDYEKCADVFEKVKFFYEPYFSNMLNEGLPFSENYSKEIIKNVLLDFIKTLDYTVSEQEWFENLKALSMRHNFAESNKLYKANKEAYLGSVNDVAEMIRISLTTSKQSPNIYYVLNILKEEKIKERIAVAISKL